ncbi:DUF1775 domain-containing protein [Actinoplanes sp. URMC 104]|uniref:DUF1775 domain-containing protein n=1 Tax=Actinoplanes sp. URMC 104 TaxID=3423409 RepID=UPI003F1D6C5D
MRHFQLARRAGVPVAVAALGVLAATPALADVTVSPSTAVQGSGENFKLHVTNDGDKPIRTVTVRLPADTPVAEVYPLSVDDWAPRIETRTVSTELPTLHGGVPTDQAASAITWLAMPGRDLAPGASTDLTVAIGPLPSLSTFQLRVATTYADGKPGPAVPPAAIKLTADPTGGQQAGHGHGGGASGTTEDPEAQLFEDTVADAERGPSVWSIAGWVVAGLALLGGAVMMVRARHRAEEDEPDEDETPTATDRSATDEAVEGDREPVAAGGTSKWAYKG